MSLSKRIARHASIAGALIGAVAVVASFAIGLTGWPPARASAAPDESALTLGVDESSTARLLPATTADDKFAGSIAAGTAVTRAFKHRELKRDKRRAKTGWRAARVSWYGPGFYGNTMAGGGRLRRDSMVVAHRSMAFGTKIEFTYNGRTVTAVVRDRGPYVSGRVFDLGPGTAKALGFSGVGTVRYRVVKR